MAAMRWLFRIIVGTLVAMAVRSILRAGLAVAVVVLGVKSWLGIPTRRIIVELLSIFMG